MRIFGQLLLVDKQKVKSCKTNAAAYPITFVRNRDRVSIERIAAAGTSRV
jgi:hypothetical protein